MFERVFASKVKFHLHIHAYTQTRGFLFFRSFYFFLYTYIFVPNSPKFNAIQATCISESKWPDFQTQKYAWKTTWENT